MYPRTPFYYWKVLKLKRLVRSTMRSSSRPLATLWRTNNRQFEGMPIQAQLNIVCFWAEVLYGKEVSEELGLIERTEVLMKRSRAIYKNHGVDLTTPPVTITDPLRIVMGELSY